MFQPLHNGSLGLIGQQRSIDVIGNNIANIGTTGFKADRLDFQDTLYTRMFNKVDMGPEMNLERGTGVREYQTATQFAQGAALESGRKLDFMLEGSGFFAYENPDWDEEDELTQLHFSRDASLYVTEVDGAVYLVDARERFIVDENMERITINGSPENLSVTKEGILQMTDESGVVTDVARFFITDFVNPQGLKAEGGGYYSRSENTGDLLAPGGYPVQGFTEASNVELAEEMTNLVRTQRAYQLAARCVTTADQMMQVCNQLGR